MEYSFVFNLVSPSALSPPPRQCHCDFAETVPYFMVSILRCVYRRTTITHRFSDLRGDRESWSPERREVSWVYWTPQEQMHPVCVNLIFFCLTYRLFQGVNATKRTTTQQDSFRAAFKSQSCHPLRCWQGELWISFSNPVSPQHMRGDGAVSTPTTTKDVAQYVEIVYYQISETTRKEKKML